ncbi:MAG: vitamin K epoxide reductase family protein [Anaerolineae bacterium]|nr:MAG: vitamin K epoxide reductase family protein [Anaerolineae bacterium]
MPLFLVRFMQDPLANSIAVIVLLALLYGLGHAMRLYYHGEAPDYHFSPWWVALLAIAGIGVAYYMTYVEVNHVEAICGPLGNCNTVQQSRYATLLGGIPVGVFGLVGYSAVLLAFLVQQRGPAGMRSTAALLLWAMLLFGNLFSAYLTFLEPFVIGATCVWCITSALLMFALLRLETPLMLEITQQEAA